jgi:hypothetical protein
VRQVLLTALTLGFKFVALARQLGRL